MAFAGVTGAGKSTLFARLGTRLLGDDRCSPVVLRNALVQNAALDVDEARAFDHLHGLLAAIEGMAGWERAAAARGQRLVVLCESFGLNLLAERGFSSENAFATLDERRAAAGIVLVHLRFDDALVEERSVMSTRLYRGPGWTRYLEGLGDGLAAQAAHFRRRRNAIAAWFARARPPVLELDTSTMAWAQLTATLHGVVAEDRL
jgi:hypothetical protein